MIQLRVRNSTVFAGLALAGLAANAQNTPAAPAPTTAAAPATEMRIERIRIEDSGGRIDELRVHGETQSITVTPKGTMPAYEVAPPSANHGPSAGQRGDTSATGGTRVWKIFGF